MSRRMQFSRSRMSPLTPRAEMDPYDHWWMEDLGAGLEELWPGLEERRFSQQFFFVRSGVVFHTDTAPAVGLVGLKPPTPSIFEEKGIG